MAKHFIFGTYFISILASLSIVKIINKFQQPRTRKILFLLIIVLIIFFSLVRINTRTNGFFGKNEIAQLIDFKEEHIDERADDHADRQDKVLGAVVRELGDVEQIVRDARDQVAGLRVVVVGEGELL